MYICIYSDRDGELILFHHEGGIDIGDVDSKALTYRVLIDESYDAQKMEAALLKNVPVDRRSYDLRFFFNSQLGSNDIF